MNYRQRLAANASHNSSRVDEWLLLSAIVLVGLLVAAAVFGMIVDIAT